jgi:opine dehydrogenase
MQGYMIEENYDTGYSMAPGFRGIRAQSELDNRYLTEDVGYTMVLFTELAQTVGVPTPTMDAVIQIASVLLGRDFRRKAPRTLASLGLDDLDSTDLANL